MLSVARYYPVLLAMSSMFPIQLFFVLSSVADFSASKENLTFMLMTSFGQYGFKSSGLIPAADMALEDINSNTHILPGYSLNYDVLRDSQCHHVKALDAFFEGIRSEPVKLAVVGSGCSVATEPVAEISHQWNISQISYASTSTIFSDRTRYRRYFRNSLTFVLLLPTLQSIMKRYSWTRIALLTQDENIFRRMEAAIRYALKKAGIDVKSRIFKSVENPTETVEDFFLESEDFRIFFLNSYSGPARKIICAAYHRGYTYPGYTWMMFDWFPQSWWTLRMSENKVNCTNEELAQLLDKSLTLRRHPTQNDVNAMTDTGITLNKFAEAFRNKTNGSQDIAYGGILYDVIWVLALALNNTMTMVANNDTNGSNCEDVPGSFVPLEQFTYANEKMGCLIQWNIQRTSFIGVSGNVVFDDSGTRIYPKMTIKQYQFEDKKLVRRHIAFLEKFKNNTLFFSLEPGIDDGYIYPNGPPPDGTPATVIHSFKVVLVIILDTIAVLGITFAIGCLLFNFAFKNRKIVKLTSPNLNYFIITGAIIMYASTFFYVLPTTSMQVIQTRCIFEHWLFTVGYTLAFGTLLAKMWRVYQIFHNPTPNKKVLKDHHLIIIAIVITGIAVLLLLLESAIPHLRGRLTLGRDLEYPSGQTHLGVREENHVWICYGASSPNFFWRVFIFSYIVALQIIGLFLAFQTKKVEIKGLNDSKYVAVIIYISSVVLIALALMTLSLQAYVNIGTGIFVAGIHILTTFKLALIFVPKMVMLYHDPKGESLSGATTVGITTITTTQAGTSDWESKVISLEKTVTGLRNQIEILRNEKTKEAGQGKQ